MSEQTRRARFVLSSRASGGRQQVDIRGNECGLRSTWAWALGLNVSVDLSLPLNAIGRPLQDSIRELRRGYQSVSECLEQALADCEQRGSDLADCRRQLAEARRSLSECERQIAERTRAESELSNRTSAIKKQLDAKSAELAQANERILRVQGECTQSQQRLEMAAEQTEHLRAQIARLETDHRENRDELSQLRGQFAPLAEAASEAVRLARRTRRGASRSESTTRPAQLARRWRRTANAACGVSI